MHFRLWHAVNNFSAALVLAFFFPRRKWWFFSFAALVSFSRIYVGVHFPSDVIGGSIIGLICSGFVLFAFLKLEILVNCIIKYKLNKINS